MQDGAFLSAAHAGSLSRPEGHRPLGGQRALIYNVLILSTVEELDGFMDDFGCCQRF